MSGETEVCAAIDALAAKGYESVPVRFNADISWHSITWLSVTEGPPGDSGSIAKTVRSVDPGAIRIESAPHV